MSNPQIIRTNLGDLIVEEVTITQNAHTLERRNEFNELVEIDSFGHSVIINIRLKGYGRFDEATVRGLLTDQLALDQPEQLISEA
jgi:2-hydroxychromene-2-carboxylate isomerase